MLWLELQAHRDLFVRLARQKARLKLLAQRDQVAAWFVTGHCEAMGQLRLAWRQRGVVPVEMLPRDTNPRI
jgi:hypothetical protein